MIFDSRTRSCSWCHRSNTMGGVPSLCVECGHRADVPRSACDCPKCVKGPEPLTRADLDAALREFGGDGGPVGRDADGDTGHGRPFPEATMSDDTKAKVVYDTDGDPAAAGVARWSLVDWRDGRFALHVESGDPTAADSPAVCMSFGGLSLAMAREDWRLVAVKILALTEGS